MMIFSPRLQKKKKKKHQHVKWVYFSPILMHPQCCFPWVHLLSLTHMRFARRLNQLCGQTFDNLSDESCNAPTLGIRLTPPPTPPAAGGLLLWLVPCHGVDEHIEGGGGGGIHFVISPCVQSALMHMIDACQLLCCRLGRHSMARMAGSTCTRIGSTF